MVDKVQDMLKHSLDAFISLTSGLAYEVCASDDAVDAMNRQMYIKIQDAIRKNPEQLESLIHLLSVSRHLERIADHATNIAEDVIYMVEGQIAAIAQKITNNYYFRYTATNSCSILSSTFIEPGS